MAFMGAGVLPYVYFQGSTYFLLGQDPWNEFSDFGGRPEKNEDAITCAARECFEELGPLLGNQNELKKKLSTAVKLDITKDNGRIYHLYLLNITKEYSSDLVSKFQQNSEKTGIAFFPTQAVFQAVRSDSGKIEINGAEFTLRSVFIAEIKEIPAYKELISVRA